MVKKLILGIMLAFLLISCVSAFDWDNVVTYENDDRTAVFDNALGFGHTIGRVTLGTPQVNPVIRGKDRRVMEFEIESYDDIYIHGLTDLEMIDMDTGKKVDKEFKWQYGIPKVRTFYREKDCGKKECDLEFAYNKTEYDWFDLEGDDIQKGITRIAIVTDVEAGDHFDGIPIIYGKRIAKWAEWYDSLSVGLKMAVNFEEGSGTTAEDVVSGWNFTTDNNAEWNSTGSINGTFYTPSGDDGFDFGRTMHDMADGGTSFSVSFWFRWQGNTGDSYARVFDMASDGDDKDWYIRMGAVEYDVKSNGEVVLRDGAAYANDNEWHHYVQVVESGDQKSYHDGHQDSVTDNEVIGGLSDAGNLHWWEATAGNVDIIHVDFDCILFYNRTLNSSEIESLNSTSPAPTCYFEAAAGGGDTYPELTLNYPLPFSNYSTDAVDLNCSATDDVGILNLTMWSDGVLLQTYSNSTANQNMSEDRQEIYSDGYHNYSCDVWDTNNQQNISNNYTFLVDTTPPEMRVDYPTGNLTFNINPVNLSFNWSAQDALIGVQACWYYNGSTNITIACDNNATINNTPEGEHTWIAYANDSLGNTNQSSITFFIYYIQESIHYETSVIEANNATFQLNLTSTAINSLVVDLVYNYTNYTTTASNTNATFQTLTTTLTTPNVSVDTTIPFYWRYWLDNQALANTSHNNQTIVDISAISVSTDCGDLTPSMCFDYQDEKNHTTQNASMEFNFVYGVGSTFRTSNGSLDNTEEFCLCINTTSWNNYSVNHGEIHYYKTGYGNRRYYIFNTTRMSNESINNTLYLLETSEDTEFLMSVQNSDLSDYPNIYLTLNRWYPYLNTYRVVEMAHTDDNGQSVLKLEESDVDYRFGVYELNGSLINLFSPVRVVCLTTPCEYTLTIEGEGGAEWEDYLGLEYTLTHNATTNIFTFTYNDPSQNTEEIQLEVWREGGNSNYVICVENSTTYTGVLTCNASGWSGMLKAMAFRTASPEMPIVTRWYNVVSNAFDRGAGLFVVFVIMALIVMVSIASPILAVILSVLAFIPAVIFGIIPVAIMFLIAAMGFLVIHFMKRSAVG